VDTKTLIWYDPGQARQSRYFLRELSANLRATRPTYGVCDVLLLEAELHELRTYGISALNRHRSWQDLSVSSLDFKYLVDPTAAVMLLGSVD